MKKLLLLFWTILLSPMLISQENPEIIHIDIEGFEPGMTMTYNDFVVKFGKPDIYRSYETEFGLDEEYEIGDNLFHFEENGVFHNFSIGDNKFRVLTYYIKEGVRVGDEFSKLDRFKPRFESDCDNGLSQYVLFDKISDDKLIVFVKNEKIISMIYNYPV